MVRMASISDFGHTTSPPPIQAGLVVNAVFEAKTHKLNSLQKEPDKAEDYLGHLFSSGGVV